MNVDGVYRDYMSKSLDGENFICLVGETIEKQLQEWDPNFSITIMKFTDYELYVTNEGSTEYDVQISEQELSVLQKKSPFSLDYIIWKDLERQGLKLYLGNGDYFFRVLGWIIQD